MQSVVVRAYWSWPTMCEVQWTLGDGAGAAGPGVSELMVESDAAGEMRARQGTGPRERVADPAWMGEEATTAAAGEPLEATAATRFPSAVSICVCSDLSPHLVGRWSSPEEGRGVPPFMPSRSTCCSL